MKFLKVFLFLIILTDLAFHNEINAFSLEKLRIHSKNQEVLTKDVKIQ